MYKFAKRTIIIKPQKDVWDNSACRDFVVTTTPDKRMIKTHGKYIGYYTGYRNEKGKIYRGICRASSVDGFVWKRDPNGPCMLLGKTGDIDEGGHIAGSVIHIGKSYFMYFSTRNITGFWTGICLAYSTDNQHWKKDLTPIISLKSFDNLRHVAVADVIRTGLGFWVLHCEGWIKSWNVFQARSNDGILWKPTKKEPLLKPPLNNAHIANPKCLEDKNGFLLGVNVAPKSLAFDLWKAKSTDLLNWKFISNKPIILRTKNDYRIESFFTAKNDSLGVDNTYIFASKGRKTHLHSHILKLEE